MSDKIKCVLALGYFDGVHLGHREVIGEAVRLAKEKKVFPIAVTFGGNLRRAVLGSGEIIYEKKEKQKLLLSLGIKTVYFAPVTKKFLSKTPKEFLDFLNKKFDVCGYVFGTDYRFGKSGSGNANDVTEYAKNKCQSVNAVKLKTLDGEKISSTRIKNALISGDVKKANELLGEPYRVTGKVVHGKRIGRTLGFPTANVKIPEKTLCLKHGVYLGTVKVQDKEYNSLINYGFNPTFDGKIATLEAFIDGIKTSIYGKEITVYFERFIREEKKFSSAEELKEQITRDLSVLKTVRG